MQTHSSLKEEQTIDELLSRHTTIKSVREAVEVLKRALGSLQEPVKTESAQAMIHLLLSSVDFEIRKKVGAVLCLHVGCGEWIPAAPRNKKRNQIDF